MRWMIPAALVLWAATVAAWVALFGCTPTPAKASETCVASTYDEGFGRPLADNRRHSPSEILAAHKTLPLGSWVIVTNLANGRTLKIRILDRGPYVRGRCLDVTRRAAAVLGFSGLTP